MSNGKILTRINGYGEVLPKSEWKVHCGSDSQGDGFLCGDKDDYHDTVFKELKGLPAAEPTDKPVSCEQCINALESASDYKKHKNGKWY